MCGSVNCSDSKPIRMVKAKDNKVTRRLEESIYRDKMITILVIKLDLMSSLTYNLDLYLLG